MLHTPPELQPGLCTSMHTAVRTSRVHTADTCLGAPCIHSFGYIALSGADHGKGLRELWKKPRPARETAAEDAGAIFKSTVDSTDRQQIVAELGPEGAADAFGNQSSASMKKIGTCLAIRPATHHWQRRSST